MTGKINILLWAVAFLLLTNMATIATILYHNHREKEEDTMQPVSTPAVDPPMINGRYFRDNLQFDDTQMQYFRVANHAFRPAAFMITREIDSLKTVMFTELQKEQPDTATLNMLSTKIGDLHGDLKNITYKFYVAIKQVSTEQQKQKLKALFQSLFITESLPVNHNTMQRRGWQSVQKK